MNPIINIMIQSQRLWDKVIKERREIERDTRSIELWKKRLNEKNIVVTRLEDEIKIDKNNIKQKELELAGFDSQFTRLEARRLQIKSEKEQRALETELDLVTMERGQLEEELIPWYDSLEKKEQQLAEQRVERDAMGVQVEADVALLAEQIDGHRSAESELVKKFHELCAGLPEEYRAKFTKIIESADGKAIVPIDGQSCSNCHVGMPGTVIMQATKGDVLVRCTNCGKFLYKGVD